jgi:class 3 adenylate cyclase
MNDTAKIVSERRLAAIMFTDMVGYSALTHRDEALAMEILEEQWSVIRGALVSHKGWDVDAIGYGFFVEFNSALHAVKCAV